MVRLSTKKLALGILYVFLILFVIVELFPILWVVSTSFKIQRDIVSWPPRIIPPEFTFENYIFLIKEMDFYLFLRNSGIKYLSISILRDNHFTTRP